MYLHMYQYVCRCICLHNMIIYYYYNSFLHRQHQFTRAYMQVTLGTTYVHSKVESGLVVLNAPSAANHRHANMVIICCRLDKIFIMCSFCSAMQLHRYIATYQVLLLSSVTYSGVCMRCCAKITFAVFHLHPANPSKCIAIPRPQFCCLALLVFHRILQLSYSGEK